MGTETMDGKPILFHQLQLLKEIRRHQRMPIFGEMMLTQCRALETRGFVTLEVCDPPRADPHYHSPVLAYAVPIRVQPNEET
jgi:hypothetical protein